MADRRGRLTIGIAQLLLVIGAVTLWVASRLPWVGIRSFDGLGQPRSVSLSGATWSTALLPLAVLWLAAAVAALAVRGWALRALAVIAAVASLAAGYVAVSLWVVPDVAARGADLAHVPLVTLVGSERHYWGAGVTLAAAVVGVLAAALLMRAAAAFGRPDAAAGGPAPDFAAKYAAPGARRAQAKAAKSPASAEAGQAESVPGMSERMIWDALDEGRDPTDRPAEPDDGVVTEGR